jgi:ABC-type dipeptide/oligopeptide/nickel transport system ATPase subunit
MTEETTPIVSLADYEKAIGLLEAELVRMEEIKSLDTRTQDRILDALEDLKRKAAAAE